MQYVGHVIRPPSEANSIILQVTVGCSHNRCTFCGAYKDQTFTIKDHDTVVADLLFAKRHCASLRRLFLADGDVLSLSQMRLLAIFDSINEILPQVKRISLYATAKAIRHKTPEQLQELRARGLDRIYLGLESGCPDILKAVRKRDTVENMIAAARDIRNGQLFLSVTVLLGLGGVANSEKHIAKTAAVLNLMQPNQVAALTLMLLPNTELGRQAQAGNFVLPEAEGMLRELRQLVEQLDCRTQFHANHASTYLPLVGRLPGEKQKLLGMLDLAMSGAVPLVAEHRRAL